MLYQYAIVFATNEIATIEGVPLVSTGFCEKTCTVSKFYFSAFGALFTIGIVQ